MKKICFVAFISFSVFISSCSKKDAASNSIPSGNNQSVGKAANDILAAGKFSSMTIELAYMPGFAPDNQAIINLNGFLNTFINKPGGIQIIQKQIAASGKTTITLDDIKSIENTNRTVFNSGTNLGLFVLYADADYNQTNTIGVAYKSTSLVIFAKTVAASSGGLNQVTRTKMESVGLQHEFGHLFGLVNLGSAMQVNHEDGGHQKHCNNANCLMYFATQSTMMGGVILSGPVPELDANCKADLRGNGGK